jgi:hypothetical protein
VVPKSVEALGADETSVEGARPVSHPTPRSSDRAFPAVYVRADRSSKQAQTRFLAITAASLVLVALGASMGAIHAAWSGWVGAGAFVAAFTLGALAVTRNVERTWYDGRAMAESAKSLTWLYMVGGGAFSLDAQDPDGSFKRRLRSIQGELRHLDYVIDEGGDEITSQMRALRESPLDTRRTTYLTDRLDDQIGYYRKRLKDHQRSANRFRGLTWAAQTLGLAGGVLKATGVVDVDLLGIGAACAAAGTAWLQTRDHVTLARAYQLTAEDLDQVREDVPSDGQEDPWSRYVADAETAMSREHVMWTARRGRSAGGRS